MTSAHDATRIVRSDELLGELRSAFPDLVDPLHRTPPRWREALGSVPREVFVRAFFTARTDGPGWRLVESPDPEWARSVLSNKALITQLNGSDAAVEAAHAGAEVTGWATSSSSQPSLMLLMLAALGMRQGERVLEIGTGSGYNAALLCAGLGDHAVTTIDVDPDITGPARERLAQLDHHPSVITGDGLAGCPDMAPYDAIIATVAIARLPRPWLEQTRDGATILFPLDTRNGGGLLPRLTVRGDTAEGHFLRDFGGFMPVRAQTRDDAALTAFRTVPDDAGRARATSLEHQSATDDAAPFEFFARLFTGGYDLLSFTPRAAGPPQNWIAFPDGSWACHTTDPAGEHQVREGGPRRLWSEIERLHEQWSGLGSPTRERFGLTVTPAQHSIWLDDPDGPHRWTYEGE